MGNGQAPLRHDGAVEVSPFRRAWLSHLSGRANTTIKQLSLASSHIIIVIIIAVATSAQAPLPSNFPAAIGFYPLQ